jgi:hypothetical protein
MGFMSLDCGAKECLPSSEYPPQTRSVLVFDSVAGTGRARVLSKARQAIRGP